MAIKKPEKSHLNNIILDRPAASVFTKCNTEEGAMKRRTFLQGTLSIVAGVGLLRPVGSLAVPEPMDAFTARSEMDVLRVLFGETKVMQSDAVKIEAPLQATGGKAIPVKVLCDLSKVDVIAVVTANNRYPLNTYVNLFDADGYYSTRIRVEQTSMVTACVRAGDALYSASTHVKVNHGGYGMHVD
jgi:sulfur-oxidizing protein SoxY